MNETNNKIPSGFKGFDALQGGYIKGLPYNITATMPNIERQTKFFLEQIRLSQQAQIDIISGLPHEETIRNGISKLANKNKNALTFIEPKKKFKDKGEALDWFKKNIAESKARIIIIKPYKFINDLDFIHSLTKDKNSIILVLNVSENTSISESYPNMLPNKDVYGQLQAKFIFGGEQHIIPNLHENRHESIGVSIIEAERIRQITQEGYSPDHDLQHKNGELADAAAAYALTDSTRRIVIDSKIGIPIMWPFNMNYYKPTPNDRIRQLAKAGAFIAAEIDRLKATNQ